MPNAPPSQYTIAQYNQWNRERRLVLAAPFQRKPVWSYRNKTYLIDTVLHNLPMPEVFMQVKTDKEGNIKYVVVDGQQRIRAILEFLDGEYSLLEEDTSPEFADKTFADLSDGDKTDFWKYSISTRELQTNSEEDVKAVFRRLNKYVVPLNDQELRNATYSGHFIHMMNNIAEKDDFWADNRIVTPNEIKHMLDAEYISELIIAMMNGIQQKDQKSINGFYKVYDETFAQEESTLKDFYAIERLIQEIFEDDLEKTRWRGKPDFYSLWVAIYDLSREYYFPPERYEEMKGRLMEFASEVDIHVQKSKEPSTDSLVAEYVNNVEKRSTHKATRQNRYKAVRDLLIPFLIARDIRRAFNEEERRIAWNLSKNKMCPLCHTVVVTFENYNLDHIVPHSKGGKTELRNSQITHKVCNIKKSNKTV